MHNSPNLWGREGILIDKNILYCYLPVKTSCVVDICCSFFAVRNNSSMFTHVQCMQIGCLLGYFVHLLWGREYCSISASLVYCSNTLHYKTITAVSVLAMHPLGTGDLWLLVVFFLVRYSRGKTYLRLPVETSEHCCSRKYRRGCL